MSAPRKRWADHSARWKREATKAGMTKTRWDAWFRLAPATRKQTSIQKYAQGESVRDQITQGLISRVIAVMTAHFPTARVATLRLGVPEMSLRQMRWTLTAPVSAIRQKARRKYPNNERNPWWYN